MNNNITINDIIQIKNIIDVCSSRGAFKAEEMESVGALYKRIKLFIDEIEARAKEQKEQNEEKKPLESVPEEPSVNDSFEKNVSMNVEASN
jgi:hypothetical protein